MKKLKMPKLPVANIETLTRNNKMLEILMLNTRTRSGIDENMLPGFLVSEGLLYSDSYTKKLILISEGKALSNYVLSFLPDIE